MTRIPFLLQASGKTCAHPRQFPSPAGNCRGDWQVARVGADGVRPLLLRAPKATEIPTCRDRAGSYPAF